MKGYTTRDVENLIGLSRRHVREYGRSGVLDPARGPGNRYLFSFQDLVLLRTAKELLDDDVPQRRVVRALRYLKEQLPGDRSLTELRIEAEGEEVVARDDERAWDPESGQLRFTFDVAELAAQVEPLAERAVATVAPSDSTVDWLELGLELETHAPAQARRAYEKVLELDPTHVNALVNLGRLLHEDGELDAAVVHYRRALEAAGGDEPTAAYNLGLALEDLGRDRAAMDAYTAALTIDPGFADAHYNLSRVYERMGDRVSALRHLKSYRGLTTGPR
ncbi:MAG: tetratricopeptide repeat protein [Gemmatimonadota bacterium]|jgi:tetratricopeptide (TPR) repeat protein